MLRLTKMVLAAPVEYKNVCNDCVLKPIINFLCFMSMASSNSSLKIHDLCRVTPPPSSPKSSLPLTFFDTLWLRFNPLEQLFFYSVPQLQSSSFFDTVVPKLKRSLSLILQHFLPLAGNIVWPSDSPKPIVQYSPGDGISLAVAVSDSDLNNLLDLSPREAVQARAFVPHLDSSASSASVISLQITLFPNSGFCIGISSHHACLDGKSTAMFMKDWAWMCKNEGESKSSCSLPQELKPFFDREVIVDQRGMDIAYASAWSSIGASPTQKNQPNLEILKAMSPPDLEGSARAVFELKRADLDKIKERVLQKWEKDEAKEEREDSKLSKPKTLSTFVLTTSYLLICIAKALERIEKKRKKPFFGFVVDCRARLEPPISENYFGNCVMPHKVDIQSEDLTHEDGVVIVAKKIHKKIMKIEKDKKEAVDGAFTMFSWDPSEHEGDDLLSIGVVGSNRFGVYQTDFGWGKPEKVEIISGDRGITMAMVESKDGNSGVEVGLVLKKHMMDQFASLFRTERDSI